MAGPVGSGSGSLGTATVGYGAGGHRPSELAFNPATHTVYVTNGYNDNGPAGMGTRSRSSTPATARRRTSRAVSGPWPTITVGNLPSSIAVDQATDTVYVTNPGDNTVSVFNGATCNAMDTLGMRAAHRRQSRSGLGPIGISSTTPTTPSMSPTRTTGTAPTTVSMIDSATCNAS